MSGPTAIFLKIALVFVSVCPIFYILAPRYFVQQVDDLPTNVPASQPARVQGNIRLIFSYRDLQSHLCDEELDWANKTTYQPGPGPKPCPKAGIVSAVFGGRTGNQMWEYASIYGLARSTSLEPYVPKCIKCKLEEFFENLTIPDFNEIADCPVDFNTFVTSIKDWTSVNQSILLARYANDERALKWIEGIKQEFQFKQKFKDKAEETLRGYAKKLAAAKGERTFVGVHVRRTDYIKYLKRKYGDDDAVVKPKFFSNAMAYYKNKYPNCVFVYVSDDPKWCSKQFGKLPNVFVSSGKTPVEDLAIMAACNHTIIDYGTFGEWGSILAGGETVYSNISQNFRKAKMMKRWTVMQ